MRHSINQFQRRISFTVLNIFKAESLNFELKSKNEVKDHSYIGYCRFQFLFGLGSLTPRTLSIFAIKLPEGKDFPASHAFTSDF